MPEFGSPLRYPGGKTALGYFLGEVIALNGIQDCIYAEPFAGGAGAALSLLFSERVSKILLNDADPCIYAFWDSILNQSGRFLSLLDKTALTIDVWRRQRDIYRNPKRHSRVRVGFATFFLNRCNRSGIIMNAGPIGGIEQKGKWKIDARFNRQELRRRINKILVYRERIEISNKDAIDFLKNDVTPQARKKPVFVYLDPP
jgi:DNA adenine methylase